MVVSKVVNRRAWSVGHGTFKFCGVKSFLKSILTAWKGLLVDCLTFLKGDE
jgi:hypothetical protein